MQEREIREKVCGLCVIAMVVMLTEVVVDNMILMVEVLGQGGEALKLYLSIPFRRLYRLGSWNETFQ